MSVRRVSLSAIVLLSAGITPVHAQSSARFGLTPRVGMSVPTQAFGPTTQVGPIRFLNLGRADASALFEIAADASWPNRRVGLRVVGSFTLPSSADGTFDCSYGIACPATISALRSTSRTSGNVLLETEAEIRTSSATAALVFSPLRDRAALQPYAVFGAGVRHYSISWSAPGEFVSAGSHAETTPVLNAGIGAAVDVSGTTFHAEIGGAWTPEGDGADLQRTLPDSGPGSDERSLKRRAQRDLAIVLGWRLVRF